MATIGEGLWDWSMAAQTKRACNTSVLGIRVAMAPQGTR